MWTMLCLSGSDWMMIPPLISKWIPFLKTFGIQVHGRKLV